MASSTPLASCPPCSDTPLAIATSAITFLTFLYALTVGLIYYYGLAKSLPQEDAKTIQALGASLRELGTMARVLRPMIAEQRVEDEAIKGHDPGVNFFFNQVDEQASSLKSLLQSIIQYSHRPWYVRCGLGRMHSILNREELQQKLADADRLMTSFCRIEQRVERIKNVGLEKARWKEQNDLLNLIRAETAEEAKLQDLRRKEQENRQSEQLQMLESISRRISSLEASGRTTTPGENSSPDPPPESTD